MELIGVFYLADIELRLEYLLARRRTTLLAVGRSRVGIEITEQAEDRSKALVLSVDRSREESHFCFVASQRDGLNDDVVRQLAYVFARLHLRMTGEVEVEITSAVGS